MPTGRIGAFAWAQFWCDERELPISDIVRELAETVIGLRAVNVSWDSGRLVQADPFVSAGWETRDGYAITPPVDRALADNWPRSSCGWDEWYFFQSVPDRIALEAYCNWGGMSLGDWQDLEFTGLNLKKQLQTYRPELVVAEGASVFVISQNEEVTGRFARLLKRSPNQRMERTWPSSSTTESK